MLTTSAVAAFCALTRPEQWHQVMLRGPFLRGNIVTVAVNVDGLIVDCARIHSVWSGTPRFDAWFRELYGPIIPKLEAHNG
jgi:hypothetical protein